jgi:cell wall-associated NlpC family hydrolase
MSTEPMVGTQVFWPNLTSSGHVALYVGNGYVITTQGNQGDGKPIASVPLSAYGAAAGWVATSDL